MTTQHDPHLLTLRGLAAPLLESPNPLARLNELTLSAQGAAVCGHILIDLLEEHDLAIGDYDLVIAPEGDAALAAAMIHAAGGRGLDLDAALFLPAQGSASEMSNSEGNPRFSGSPLAGRTAVLLANSALADGEDILAAATECGAQIVGCASLLPDEAARAFAAAAGIVYCSPALGD
jgi:orotate phosphoribosyltransferase